MQIIIAVLLIVIARAAHLPPSFLDCQQGTPDFKLCNSRFARRVATRTPGTLSFESLSIDPLPAARFSSDGSNGEFKQDCHNIILHGLSRGFKISDFMQDTSNSKFSFTSFNPKVDFEADCSLSGKLLRQYIRSNGRTNVTMLDLEIQHTFYAKKFLKDGDEYLIFEKYDAKFTVKKVILNFENVSIDNFTPARAQSFVKRYWRPMFEKMKRSYERILGNAIMDLGNGALGGVPMGTIFATT